MKRKFGVLLALIVSLLTLVVPRASATDFIAEIDSVVVSIHDYSVLTGKVSNKLSDTDIKNLTSKLNNQLSTIRNNIVKYDKDLSYNWKILIDNDNVNYPHRQLLKDFNIQVFDWFNNELRIQKNVKACFAKKSGQTNCVVAIRNKAKAIELKKYKALTDTLSEIQAWRTRYNR